MNQRLMQSNPFTRFGMMAVVLSFTTAACVAERASASDAQVSSSSKPTDAEVLLYTDNTAGSIFFAKAEQEVIRRSGMIVQVVTDEETFIEALPEKEWTEVIVVARYHRGEPPYAAALRAYMRTGEGEGPLGKQYLRDIRVHFYYWLGKSASSTAGIYYLLDKPASPAEKTEQDVPGTFILAPTLVQDWLPLRKTLFAYTDGGTGKYSIVPGYAFATFDGFSAGSPERYKESAMKPLEPGVYATIVAKESGSAAGDDGGEDGECSVSVIADLVGCRETFNERQDLCRDKFGPTWDGGSKKSDPMKRLLEVAAMGDVACKMQFLGSFKFCDLTKETRNPSSSVAK